MARDQRLPTPSPPVTPRTETRQGACPHQHVLEVLDRAIRQEKEIKSIQNESKKGKYLLPDDRIS